jgi:hypothetical protein
VPENTACVSQINHWYSDSILIVHFHAVTIPVLADVDVLFVNN